MQYNIFDRQRLKIHREIILGQKNFLKEFAAESICHRLKILGISSGRVFEIGAGAGELTKGLLHFDVVVTDASAKLLNSNPCQNKFVVDDEYISPQADLYDVVLSCLNLHWINDVVAFLQKTHICLKPGGVFIANFIGGSSLKSLRAKLLELETSLGSIARPHVSPFITKEVITGLMKQAGFSSIVTDSDVLDVEYPSCFALMRDLQRLGESNKMVKTAGQNLDKRIYRILISSQETFVTEFEIITIYGKK